MIDLARVKAHLRIEASDTEQDDLLAAYLASAIGTVEDQTGYLLAPREVVQRVSAGRLGGPIRLYKRPVRGEPATVSYVGSDGADATLADFRVVEGADGLAMPALGQSWPSVEAGHPAALTITYSAGFDADDVPPAIEQAVLLLVGHFYLSREAVVVGTIATTLPMAVDSLLGPYRPLGIA